MRCRRHPPSLLLPGGVLPLRSWYISGAHHLASIPVTPFLSVQQDSVPSPSHHWLLYRPPGPGNPPRLRCRRRVLQVILSGWNILHRSLDNLLPHIEDKFESHPSASYNLLLHARAEKHARRTAKSRPGGTSAVYEDPHRLSLRRLRLRDMLNEDNDSTELASSHGKPAGQEKEGGHALSRLAIVAVGGRGHWDEPLVSGEIYDPSKDKWVEIAGFPADVGLACSGAVCGRTFYVYCESDTLVAYHLDEGAWVVVQTSQPPRRLRDYAPTLVCCASRLLMLCVSWCDRHGPASRSEKVVRKLFELDLTSLQWTEAARHPDAPMDPNAAFAEGQDMIYAVEMFRIFGKVLDFVTACRVSDLGQNWSRIARKNTATEVDAMSSRLKSMAVLHLQQIRHIFYLHICGQRRILHFTHCAYRNYSDNPY